MIAGVIIPSALKRGIDRPRHEGELDPLSIQMVAVETKNKVLKRLHDMEDSQKIKFTEAELESLIVEVVSVIAEYVDANTLRKISARIGVRAVSAEAD